MDTDKIREVLTELYNEGFRQGIAANIQHEPTEEIDRAMAAIEEEMPRWISVEEGLPEQFVWLSVLTRYLYDDRRYPNIAMWDEGRWKFINGNGMESDFGTVIHWQPLPAPPEEEK